MKIAIFEESRPVRTCDPGPAYSARRLKTSEESLTDLQKAIYNFVKSKGKVTKQEITDKFTRSQVKIEKQLSILRYLALIMGEDEEEKLKMQNLRFPPYRKLAEKQESQQ